MVDYEGTAIGEHLQLCARIICEKKLGSSAMVFPGIIGPATLEALTCREALALALDLSLQKIVVSCDYKSVVSEIKEGTRARYGVIIREIKARAAEFELCEFVFEGRAMNVDAHSLAKFSSSLDQCRHLWLGAPHDPFIISVNLPVE